MRWMGRTGLALLLSAALLLSCGQAMAEFSPGYAALANENGMRMEVTARFDTLHPLSEKSLEIVNEWLDRLRLRATVFRRAEETLSRGEVLLDQQPWLSVTEQADREKTLTVFLGGDGYVTAAGQESALALLSGQGDGLPQLAALPERYAAIAPAMRALLDTVKAPKNSKEDTSVKNAAAADAYDTYTLTREEMNALWPQLLELLLPEVQKVLADMPGASQRAETLLRGLTFSEQCRFKCLYDKAGADMGLQFTGNAGYGADVRKVTLFGGYTPGKGGSVSLSLPAVKGKNTFKFTFAGKLSDKEEKKTLTLEGTYTNTLDDQKDTASLEATLTNNLSQGAEAWTGTAEIDTDFGGKKINWTLKPQLALDETGLHGEIALQEKSGKTILAKGSVFLTAARLEAPPDMPYPEITRDLRGMGAAEARVQVQSELVPLTRALMRLLGALPEESRALLTHDLRNEAWMNGPTVSALPGLDGVPLKIAPEDDQWIVSEEEDIEW